LDVIVNVPLTPDIVDAVNSTARPSRDFPGRTIFDFCNNIGTKRTLGDVCYLVANGGKADMAAKLVSVAIDPDVWSGHALQVDFAELAVSGPASMYPAFDWSVWCSGPSWISARVRSR
jgi:hypothetical protein